MRLILTVILLVSLGCNMWLYNKVSSANDQMEIELIKKKVQEREVLQNYTDLSDTELDDEFSRVFGTYPTGQDSWFVHPDTCTPAFTAP